MTNLILHQLAITAIFFDMGNKTKSKYMLSDKEADKFFEELEVAENFISTDKLADELGDEQFTYEATPYSYILDFLNKFGLRKKDVVYDLGSGYGRFVIFCAMNSDAKFKGIEISKKRHEHARELAQKLGLKNVELMSGNVLDFDFSDGDIFFLFNPFHSRTLSQVGEKLRQIAQDKQIKIATWGGASNDYFREQSWLEPIADLDPYIPIDYYTSKKSC